MRIHILASARFDISEGRDFFERQAPGIGAYFLDSIFSDIDSLIVTAGVHPIQAGYHRILSKRFPFAVYYKCNDNTVIAYAVLDCRRDPAWLRKRLRG